jgi:hypothetical protein
MREVDSLLAVGRGVVLLLHGFGVDEAKRSHAAVVVRVTSHTRLLQLRGSDHDAVNLKVGSSSIPGCALRSAHVHRYMHMCG